MTNNINNVPMDYLLALYLDYHFQDRRMLDISHESLMIITDEINGEFPLMEVTTADAKAAWICWLYENGYDDSFEEAINNLQSIVYSLYLTAYGGDESPYFSTYSADVALSSRGWVLAAAMWRCQTVAVYKLVDNLALTS